MLAENSDHLGNEPCLDLQERIRNLEQKLADVQSTSYQAEAQLAGSNEVTCVQ